MESKDLIWKVGLSRKNSAPTVNKSVWLCSVTQLALIFRYPNNTLMFLCGRAPALMTFCGLLQMNLICHTSPPTQDSKKIRPKTLFDQSTNTLSIVIAVIEMIIKTSPLMVETPEIREETFKLWKETPPLIIPYWCSWNLLVMMYAIPKTELDGRLLINSNPTC